MSKNKKPTKEAKKAPSENVSKAKSDYQSAKGSVSADLTSKKK
jgi:hypothetical protein